MVNFVIKKDGTRAPFEIQKIKEAIANAAKATGLSEERKAVLAEQVTATVLQGLEGREEVATSEIKKSILEELDIVEPSVSSAWRKYDEENKEE
jgi:transcriptional regulator NrdR family protein